MESVSLPANGHRLPLRFIRILALFQHRVPPGSLISGWQRRKQQHTCKVHTWDTTRKLNRDTANCALRKQSWQWRAKSSVPLQLSPCLLKFWSSSSSSTTVQQSQCSTQFARQQQSTCGDSGGVCNQQGIGHRIIARSMNCVCVCEGAVLMMCERRRPPIGKATISFEQLSSPSIEPFAIFSALLGTKWEKVPPSSEKGLNCRRRSSSFSLLFPPLNWTLDPSPLTAVAPFNFDSSGGGGDAQAMPKVLVCECVSLLWWIDRQLDLSRPHEQTTSSSLWWWIGYSGKHLVEQSRPPNQLHYSSLLPTI